MCENLSKVALDCAAAGIEHATFSRKSNALTTAPPSHTNMLFSVVNFLEYAVTEVLFSLVAFKTLTFHKVVHRHIGGVAGSLVVVFFTNFLLILTVK